MSPKKGDAVPRPIRSTEYTIIFGTAQARKGWRDLLAVQKNTVVAAWDRLTKDPLADDSTCHGLRGDLEHIAHQGEVHARRQYELSNGARIWFYVAEREVILVDVHTHHPNQTK